MFNKQIKHLFFVLNGSYIFENIVSEQNFEAVIVKLLVELSGEFLRIIWNLVIKKYPKFVKILFRT